jgi:hypothetical protein
MKLIKFNFFDYNYSGNTKGLIIAFDRGSMFQNLTLRERLLYAPVKYKVVKTFLTFRIILTDNPYCVSYITKG